MSRKLWKLIIFPKIGRDANRKRKEGKNPMKALRFHETGSLANLKIEDVAMPEPKDGEVLVKIKAASINPADIKNVLGLMKGRTTLPRIPGRDFAGIVVKGGNLEGKAVFGSCPVGLSSDGVQAEYALLPADGLLLKPENLSFEACAAIGIPYMTAWAALIEAARIAPNEHVLITGVNGAVGTIAAQLAKQKRAKVIGVIRKGSEKKSPSPVDVWIDLETEDLAKACMEATNQKGVEVTFDTVGGALFRDCIHCLSDHGRHIVIASQEPTVSFDIVDFYRHQATIRGVDTLKFTAKESADILSKLLPLIATNALATPIPKTISLAEAPSAYQQLQDGTLKGKVVILME